MTTRLDRLLADLSIDPAPLAQIERDAKAARRRRTLMVAGVAAATAIVIAGSALAITGPLTAGDGEKIVIDPAARQELAAANGEVCPADLPQAPGSDGDGTGSRHPSRRTCRRLTRPGSASTRRRRVSPGLTSGAAM